MSDLVGQDVTIEFITIDCGAGGHWGYAYIDDFCSTCGPGPEGAIQVATSSDCGAGKICVDVTVPKAGTQTGQATVSLDIWQNGIKVTTLNQPAINADGQVCFPINPSTITGLDLTKGFDYSAKADLKIGTVILSPKTLGSGPNGTKPGVNNDYSVNCSVGSVCGAPGQPPCPACGQEGQPPCPTCGQPGQPLCPDICTRANPTGNANAAASNRLGNFLGNLRNAARGTTGKPAALEKKVIAVGPSVNGNYTINWVVSYANTSNQALSNVIVRDGPIATIIPGSLQQPTGWTGATNAASGNTPADNYAQWNGALVPPHGVMTQTLPAAGPGNVTVGGGGDGFQPIPFVHSTGRRIYIMNHHANPGDLSFGCVNMNSGANCAGTWPRVLPFGDGSGAAGTTSANAEYVIVGSKFYYPAHNFSKWGIGCFDLESELECGYTPLGASNDIAKQTTLTGPWRVDNELYMADYDGQLYCAKLAAGMPSCLSTGYKIPLTDIKISMPTRLGQPSANVLDWYNGLQAGRVVGTRLYITSRSRWAKDVGATIKYTNCFDTVAKTACWSTSAPTKGTGAHNFIDPYGINQSNYIYYSTTGTALALCTKTNTSPWQQCVDINTGGLKALPEIFPGLPALTSRVTLEVDAWPRTYFTHPKGPSGQLGTGGDAYCWDWSIANYCNNFVGTIAEITGTPGDYGNNIDDRGCIWTFGHNHTLWGYNPNDIDPATSRAKPCGSDPGKALLTFQPLQYCSGPKPFKWTAVEVKGTTLANMDKLIVKVLDPTTSAVLYTKDLKAGGALSTPITSVNAQTESKPLKIELEYTPKAGTNDKPYVEVRYDAPALELCFTSKHTCAQGNITNIVETQDPLNLNSIITASATVAKPVDCPCISCGTANTPSCPVCGQAGQPPCPSCGQLGQPPCGTCGGAGQPPCNGCGGVGQPACTSCGSPGQAPCTGGPACIPGTPGCPIIVIGGCIPGTPGCPLVRPPPSGVCLTGNCDVEKPKQSVAEEFKEPKVSCVRKPKETEEVKKPSPPKPKPKPVAANPAPKPAVEAEAKPAAPKPAPKPRPKPAPKPKEQDDDDC